MAARLISLKYASDSTPLFILNFPREKGQTSKAPWYGLSFQTYLFHLYILFFLE